MPCDSQITNTTEFSAGTDMELMKEALTAAGYTFFAYQGGLAFNHHNDYQLGGKFVNGLFTTTQGTDTNTIKRHYSAASVRATAKKMGWQIKQDAKNPFKMQVVRRA